MKRFLVGLFCSKSSARKSVRGNRLSLEQLGCRLAPASLALSHAYIEQDNIAMSANRPYIEQENLARPSLNGMGVVWGT